MNCSKNLSKSDIISLFIIGCLYYFQIRLYVNPVEDVMYAYIRTLQGGDFSRPISSIFDAISSQYCDYQTMNGRFINHVFIQYLCGMPWGKELFFLFSTISFVLLILGIKRLVYELSRRDVSVLIPFIFLLLFTPVPGRTILGHIAFTINYLWTSTVVIWFIVLFIQECHTASNKIPLWHYFFAFVAGALHEGFSIPVLGGLFCYYCLYIKQIKPRLIMLALCFFLGSCTVIFAPANFIRVVNPVYVGTEPSGIKKWLTTSISLVRNQFNVQLLLILLLYSFYLFKKKKEQLMHYLLPIVIAIVSVLFAVFVTLVGEHQLMPVALMLTVSYSMIITGQNIDKNRFYKPVLFLLLVGMLIPYSTVYSYRKRLVVAWENMHKEAAKAGVDYANGHAMYLLTQDMSKPLDSFTQINSCMMHISNNHYFEKLTSVIATNGKNPEKIKVCLPDTKEDIASACHVENRVSDNIYTVDDYLIVRMPQDRDEETVSIEYSYKPTLLNQLCTKYLHRPITVQQLILDPSSHSFTDDRYRYYIAYIEYDSLLNVGLSNN